MNTQKFISAAHELVLPSARPLDEEPKRSVNRLSARALYCPADLTALEPHLLQAVEQEPELRARHIVISRPSPMQQERLDEASALPELRCLREKLAGRRVEAPQRRQRIQAGQLYVIEAGKMLVGGFHFLRKNL